MSVNDVYIVENPIHMWSGETRDIPIDVTDLMAPGESLSSATSSLTNLATGAAYAGGLSGSASVSGSIITQRITSLAANTNYRLLLGATFATGKILQTGAEIQCLG